MEEFSGCLEDGHTSISSGKVSLISDSFSFSVGES